MPRASRAGRPTDRRAPVAARAAGQAARFEDFGDVFSDFFSGGFQGGGGARNFSARGRDVRYTLDVEFTEAVQGAKKRVSLPDGGTLDLSVPEGVSDGQVLRLRGRGEPGMGEGEAGDALVEVRVRPHRDFERQGNDILLELPITIDEAVLGARIEVPTVSGRVHLTIPKGTSSGQVLRLKGKGVRSGPAGHGGRSAREGAHRAARNHRRQPVLLPHRMAPEARLRSWPQVISWSDRPLPRCPKEWREPRPWIA